MEERACLEERLAPSLRHRERVALHTAVAGTEDSARAAHWRALPQAGNTTAPFSQARNCGQLFRRRTAHDAGRVLQSTSGRTQRALRGDGREGYVTSGACQTRRRHRRAAPPGTAPYRCGKLSPASPCVSLCGWGTAWG